MKTSKGNECYGPEFPVTKGETHGLKVESSMFNYLLIMGMVNFIANPTTFLETSATNVPKLSTLGVWRP